MPIHQNILAVLMAAVICSCSHKASKIGVQPFIGADPIAVETISSALVDVYGVEVVVLPEIEMPPGSFINVKSPRYRADSIIAWLRDHKAADIDHVIGVTHHDISTTKRNADGTVKDPAYKYQDWGVFGLGYRPGESCVVSSFRLKHSGEAVYLDRLQKVAVHEIGHNQGLGHCSSIDCVMQDAAESISTIDGVELNLCEACSAYVLP
jgi:archaemetzincin